MKRLTVLRLAFVFAGFFLGAGYVSGQELYQFFGSFGTKGLIGFFIGLALLFVYGLSILRLAQLTETDASDRLFVKWNIPMLRTASTVLQLVLLFGACVIMTAGVGALGNQLFGLPQYIGCALFAIFVASIALFGLQGVISVFSMSVPLLCGAVVFFFVLLAFRGELKPIVPAVGGEKNILLSHWLLSAVNFSSYCCFGSVAIIAPMAKLVKDRRTTIWGAVVGTVLLILLGLCVLYSSYSMPESLQTELPMLTLSMSLHPALGWLYAFLLLCAMFGAALSSLVAIISELTPKVPVIRKHKTASIFALCGIMFVTGLAGFGDLIGIIYPAYGYIGFAFMVMLVWQYITVLRDKKKTGCKSSRFRNTDKLHHHTK